jgi:hypothetical protein
MNKKQKVIFLVGVGIIVGMGLIPPWHCQVLFGLDQRIPFTMDAGYRFLFSPPTWESYPSQYRKGSTEDNQYEGTAAAPSIALSQLSVQWVVVAIGVGGILIVLRRSQKEKP